MRKMVCLELSRRKNKDCRLLSWVIENQRTQAKQMLVFFLFFILIQCSKHAIGSWGSNIGSYSISSSVKVGMQHSHHIDQCLIIISSENFVTLQNIISACALRCAGNTAFCRVLTLRARAIAVPYSCTLSQRGEYCYSLVGGCHLFLTCHPHPVALESLQTQNFPDRSVKLLPQY